MDVSGAGTAIMVAIAALLWFFYFVPTWMARREYLDTERTATRLQQTLRIMAETAELPDQVRVEATARDAARHERVLRAQQKADERRADLLAVQAAVEARAMRSAAPRSAAAISWNREPMLATDVLRLRRRRAHRLASLLMTAATATIGIQLALTVITGIVPAAWIIFAGGAGLGIAGVTVRRRADSRSVPATEATTARVTAPTAAPSIASRAPSRAAGWTPVPVPPPLYLSKPEAQPVVPALDLAAQLRAAARADEEALRAAHAEPEVTPIRRAEPSRWASMGRVGETEGSAAASPDLDEVLRRRRQAG